MDELCGVCGVLSHRESVVLPQASVHVEVCMCATLDSLKPGSQISCQEVMKCQTSHKLYVLLLMLYLLYSYSVHCMLGKALIGNLPPECLPQTIHQTFHVEIKEWRQWRRFLAWSPPPSVLTVHSPNDSIGLMKQAKSSR